jgi:hypothetical protein
MNRYSGRGSRVVLQLLLLAALAGVAPAQSGRCVMEGYVVGESVYTGVGGATVELVGDPESPRLRSVKLSAVTDGQGKYSLKQVPHGDYTLRVSAPGYAAYQIKIYMLSDATTQLHVRLRKERPPDGVRK